METEFYRRSAQPDTTTLTAALCRDRLLRLDITGTQETSGSTPSRNARKSLPRNILGNPWPGPKPAAPPPGSLPDPATKLRGKRASL